MTLKTYKQDRVCIQHNKKTGEAGTIDIFRGCPGCELRKTPCYASKGAQMTGIDFFHPIERTYDEKLLRRQLENYPLDWLRIGCISDPSLRWDTTIKLCHLIREYGKTPVIVTKAHRPISNEQLEKLAPSDPILQVSISALASWDIRRKRFSVAEVAKDFHIRSSIRINSLAFDPELISLSKKTADLILFQENIIRTARENKMLILETPVRLFQTSPIWELVDHSKYHRHLSPISGKLDNQRTAGLIIKGEDVYPCFSSCSEIPTETDSIGCSHQCLVRV